MFCRLPTVTIQFAPSLLSHFFAIIFQVTMFKLVIYIFLLGLFVTSSSANCTPLHKISGSLNIIGVFNLQTGENCSDTNYLTQQSAHNLIKSVEAVKLINLVPNIEIGLSIFNLCPNKDSNGKLDSMCLKQTGGTILQGYSDEDINNYDFPVVKVEQNPPIRLYSKIIARVVYKLKLTPINHLVIEEGLLKNLLIKELTKLQICIFNVSSFDKIDHIKNGGYIIIVGEFAQIKALYRHFPDTIILAVPTDGVYDDLKDWTMERLLVLLPSRVEPDEDLAFDDLSNSTREEDLDDMRISSTSLSQIQLVSDVVNLIKATKSRLHTVCKNLTVCPEFENKHFNAIEPVPLKSTGEIPHQLKVLGLDIKDSTCAVIFEQSSETLTKIGEVKLIDYDWDVEVEFDTPGEPSVCGISTNCSGCLNYNNIVYGPERFQSMLVLRDEAWVAALLSVSAVGLISCLAIAIFIVVRICKKDTLEGNPSFSFLMLISLILVYVSILPFAFKVEDNPYLSSIICGLKVIGTSFSYSLVFSVMLARSLMLASCDEDGGFMSHVNGYLQSVLCFFIAAVQIALTIQFWAINWFFTDREQCRAMSRGPLFLYLLGYDVFLLVLLICVSPFIMRSKRNYEEGGYFASSSLLCLLVWISWASGYVFLPDYSDVFVCSGLVATATVILVVVFIPRTYLMMTGIVRDHLVSTLPTLTHTTSSVMDVNYRSTQALYDTVSARGQVNPNFYAERPTTPSTSKMEEGIDGNHYDNYDRSPSPLNTTRF